MNKERLKLCREFTNAEVIAEKRTKQEQLDDVIAVLKVLSAVSKVYSEYKKPWYKKIF